MSSSSFNNNNTSIILGDLVAHFPKAGPFILNKAGVDFCCGGQRSLLKAVDGSEEKALEIIQAIEKKQLELSQAATVETSTTTTTTDFLTMSTPDLVQHIVSTHHDYLRENIPILSQLLLKIYSVHMGKILLKHHHYESGLDNGEESTIELMENLYKTFQSLSTELLVHLAKEEKDVFPLLIECDKLAETSPQLTDGNSPQRLRFEKLKQKLARLCEEHDEAGKLIKLLAAMKTEVPNYCKSVENAKRLLTEMEENLYIHVHLENNILFKRVLKKLNL